MDRDFERSIKYEVARELINTRLASLSARIGAEEEKSEPDMHVVEELEEQMLELGVEMDWLDSTDEAAIDECIEKYRIVRIGEPDGQDETS